MATVSVEHLRSSEAAKIASLTAKLGARLEMWPNSETNTQNVEIRMGSSSSDSALAALVACAAALSNKTPEAILEETRKLLQKSGFEIDSVIGN